MALNKQVHLYSVDTSCFYTDKEKELGDNLSKWYPLRKKIKQYSSDIKDIEDELRKERLKIRQKHQLKRVNKIINKQKDSLIKQFLKTRENMKIRELREEILSDKKVVSIFESDLTRTLKLKTNELTDELMIIQVYFFQVAEDLIKDGFMYNGEKYVLFSSSAGQIRTKKFVVIKESSLNKIKDTLTCGLDWDKINHNGGVNSNKYLAYYSLLSSATDVWEGFDIDKCVVVEDFETMVNSQVDFIDDATYEIKRKLMDVPIPHTDGCGIKLYGKTEMVRLAWFKGLMGTIDYVELILEWREKYNNPKIGIIKDIYGKEYDIIADNIECIFTKSQFKMWKYYESWDNYKNNFKKYNCKACVCNTEEDYIKDAKINYQMLQSLSDIKEQEMAKLAEITIRDINNLGNDYRTMMKILGVTEHNKNKNYMQKSLEIYPELMRDKYNRQILKDCKVSLVKDGKAGKIAIKGKYTFVLPDLYAFCEWLFLGEKNPKGLLEDGEVSCKLYKNGINLDCLRSPHLYREHAVRKNIRNETTDKWFQGNAIYTSTKDLISKVLQFDVDGDKLLVVSDKLLCRIAKRNMKDIVPLYYDMKKAPSQEINKDTLFNGLIEAYKGGNIGVYSNNISKIWNSGQIGQEQLNVIKLLCMENNFVIDMAKTLYKPTRPKEIDKTIKYYTKLKLPHFFKYAKGKKDNQISQVNSSPMNILDRIIPNPTLRVNKTISKINTNILLSNKNFKLDRESETVVKCYDYWNINQYFINYFNREEDSEEDFRVEQDIYLYQKIREKILKLPYDKDFIVNSLVKFLYVKRKSSHKKLLWACFGEEIYNNIQTNTQSLGKICPICGKRFKENSNSQKTCNSQCSRLLDIENKRNNRSL